MLDASGQNGSCMGSERIQVLVPGCCRQLAEVVERGDGQAPAHKNCGHLHMHDMVGQVEDEVPRWALFVASTAHLPSVRSHHSRLEMAIGSQDA